MGGANCPKTTTGNPAPEADAIALTPAGSFRLLFTGVGAPIFYRMNQNLWLTNILNTFAANTVPGTPGKYQMQTTGTRGFFPTSGSNAPYIDLASMTPTGVRDASFEVTVQCTFERGPVQIADDERTYVSALGLMSADVSATGNAGDYTLPLTDPANSAYAVQILEGPFSNYDGAPAGTVVFKGIVNQSNLLHSFSTTLAPVGSWPSGGSVNRLYLIAQSAGEGGVGPSGTYNNQPAIVSIYVTVKFIGGLQDGALPLVDNDL